MLLDLPGNPLVLFLQNNCTKEIPITKEGYS
jgi:hypothetical protein